MKCSVKYPWLIAVALAAALAPGLPLNGRALAAEPDLALRAKAALALAVACQAPDGPALPAPRRRAAGCTCGPDCPCADRARCGPAACPALPRPKRKTPAPARTPRAASPAPPPACRRVGGAGVVRHAPVYLPAAGFAPMPATMAAVMPARMPMAGPPAPMMGGGFGGGGFGGGGFAGGAGGC